MLKINKISINYYINYIISINQIPFCLEGDFMFFKLKKTTYVIHIYVAHGLFRVRVDQVHLTIFFSGTFL